MTEPKACEQYHVGGCGLIGSRGEPDPNGSIGAIDGENAGEKGVSTLEGKQGWRAPSITEPWLSESNCDGQGVPPVSADLLWLLTRPFEQGREIVIYKGQATLTILDDDLQPCEAELPGGCFAIVPISAKQIRLRAGEVRFIRRRRAEA